VAQDLSLAGNLNNPILKSYIRRGAVETLGVGYNFVNGTASDLAAGYYSISCSGSPFTGDIAEVLIYSRALTVTEQREVETYLTNKWEPVINPVTLGLQMWLDASEINPNDSTQVGSSGGTLRVINWRDLSGNGYNASQPIANNPPLYVANVINGNPVVRFGMGHVLLTSLPQIAGDKTIFVVETRNSTGVGTEISSDAQTSGEFLSNSNAGAFEAKGRLNVAYDLQVPATIGVPAVKRFVRSSGTETLSLNNNADSGAFPDSAAGHYTISSPNYAFTGDVAEVLIYNRALSPTEQQEVETYLTNKWKPATIPVTSGLQLWLDADAINPNDPTQVGASGGTPRVTNWLDLSGSGFNATQSIANNPPLYVPNALNGNAVVRFGAGHYLSTLLPQISGDKTIFVVETRNSTGVGTELSSDTQTSGDFLSNSNAGAVEAEGRLNVAYDLQVPATIGVPAVKCFMRASGTEILSLNDTSVSGTFPDAFSGHYTVSSSGYPFTGDIAEIIVYNRALSGAEQESVQSYLEAKWGVYGPSSLPVTSGLSLWLDANAIDPSDPTEVVNSGTNQFVQTWRDRSVNHGQAAQLVSGLQPRYVPNAIYGYPAVRFDGTNDFLTTTLPQFTGDKSIFVVQRRMNNSVTGMEIGSSGTTGIFLANSGTNETAGRVTVGNDLSVPGGIASVITKMLIFSGTTETLAPDYYQAGMPVTISTLDSSGGYFTVSNPASPFPGDIAEVIVYNRALSGTEYTAVSQYLNAKWSIWPENDIRSVPTDITPPAMTTGSAGPGLRVQQTTPGYGYPSTVYHTLYLPTDWQPGKKYPVIVDYAGNYLGGTGDIPCTGNVENINFGYGITGGTGCIWVCMPTIGGSPLANQNTWWGTLASTVAYCQQTVLYVCQNYGGDPSAVILSGFSRGGIACNYVGLNDPVTADIWLAFIPHAHYDGVITTWPYPNADDASALVRLQRLDGRLQWLSDEETSVENPQAYLESTGVSMAPFSFNILPYVNHTDIWTLCPIPLRQTVRTWLQNVLANRPGTYSIQGVVTTLEGAPIAGATVQSGLTHFTQTGANGTYTLGGLINSARTVTATASGYTFSTTQTVTISGSNVTGINFKSTQ
jgi:hypothetical protein